MEEQAYKLLETNSKIHWWNKSKEAILLDLIKSLNIHKKGSVLELGIGTGDILAKLDFTKKIGIDSYIYKNGNYGDYLFLKADINKIPIKANSIDLILAVDVLEHMENDLAVVIECLKTLKEKGKLLIFVPAFQFLWSDLDETSQHYRRYNAEGIENLLKHSGFKYKAIKKTYLNFFLFFPIFSIRLMQRLLKNKIITKDLSSLEPPNKFSNILLRKIFASERFFLRIFDFPYGTSFLYIAEKQ